MPGGCRQECLHYAARRPAPPRLPKRRDSLDRRDRVLSQSVRGSSGGAICDPWGLTHRMTAGQGCPAAAGKNACTTPRADLHRLGYQSAVIPWTDAIEFYRKACGATVAERFVTLGV